MEIFIGFEKKPLFFTRPESVILCDDPALLQGSLREVEDAISHGFFVAGFLSYEAGYCFEPCLDRPGKKDFPLLMMGVYRAPSRGDMPGGNGSFSVEDFRVNVSREEYFSRIGAIREQIAFGNVYQITYCVKFLFSFRGNDRALFTELWRRQPVPYPAFIRTPSFSVLSLSPERFLKKEGCSLLTEPMKGTWPRGATLRADRAARRRFREDPKNRAENLMIADLLRNDLGRIGKDIQWPRVFTVSAYRLLFQMTSTITARVPAQIPFRELFAALFPSGSVTGAPKIRAMEVIRGLEREERRIYTGAIGYITPRRDCYFNVPIRTLLIRNGAGEMGVGGGIIWDSTPEGEWEEGMLKARFLTGLSGVL